MPPSTSVCAALAPELSLKLDALPSAERAYFLFAFIEALDSDRARVSELEAAANDPAVAKDFARELAEQLGRLAPEARERQTAAFARQIDAEADWDALVGSDESLRYLDKLDKEAAQARHKGAYQPFYERLDQEEERP